MMTPAEWDALAEAVAERVARRLSEQTIAGDALLGVHQAAELLGCSVPTVERAVKRGDLPSIKVGRLRRFRRSDLLAAPPNEGANHE